MNSSRLTALWGTDKRRKDLQQLMHPFLRLLSILHYVTRAQAKEARLSDNINRRRRTEGKRGKHERKSKIREGNQMKWEARANRKGEMMDGRKSGRIEREMQQQGKETMKGWTQGREREREKPSTLYICSIIHHIPRSAAHTHTHTHTKPARASPRRGNFSHACKQEQRTPKTEDHT